MTHCWKLWLSGASLLALASPALAQETPERDELPPEAQLPTSVPEGADRADDTGELAPSNEIVVTARRRAESVQDVPQTVNVVTAAQVEKLDLRTFTEIASVVPGLQLTTTSAFSNQATVRGIAFSPEASGNNPSVEFYLNDAPISSAFLFQTTFDFGQFELQRGPQGTLRGRASPSGSIAVTTRRPDLDEVGVVFNGTITDLDARKLDGAFNIPIIGDVLAVRLAGAIDNNDGNQVRTTKEGAAFGTNEDSYRRTQAIRASVRFEPVDWAEFNVMYQSLHNETHRLSQVASNSLFVSGAPQTTLLIRPFDRLSIEDQGTYDRQDQDVVVGNADLRFAGQRLSYVGSYSEQKFGVLTAQDPTDFFGNPGRVPLAPRNVVDPDPRFFGQVCAREIQEAGVNTTTGTFFQCVRTAGERQTHELRLASDERIAGIFDYVIGGFYDDTETRNQLTQETPLPIRLPPAAGGAIILNPSFPVAITPIRTDNLSTEKSVFGNVTAHLLDDRLELSGGLRYIDYESTQTITTFQNNPRATAPVVAARQAFPLAGQPRKIDATVYLASAKYEITRDIMVYALTASSFRPPATRPGNFSLGSATGGGQTLRELNFTRLPPERSKSYEVGAKTSFLDGRARFNISAYHQEFENYPFAGSEIFFRSFGQTAQGVAAQLGSFQFISAVPVDVNGVEGEASFNITDRWNIGANASYADGKIKNGTIACTDVNRDNIPDVAGVDPTPTTVAQLNLPAGENVALCTGFNGRSTFSPKFSANVQSELGFGFGGSMDGFVRGLFSFFGKTPNDPANRFDDVGAYGLLNVFAGLRDPDGAWEITAFAKNVLREREILNVSATPLQQSFRTPVPTFVSQYRSVNVTVPREFGISLRLAVGSR